MHMSVSFCLCLVCIFCQCTYFENTFPPGSLQAVETLLEISPVSFIMLLLPFFFPLAEGIIWAFLTFLAGYYFRYCIKVHLICCPNFPCSRHSIIGEMLQEGSKTWERKWAETDMPKNTPREMIANETKADISLEGWERGRAEREKERRRKRRQVSYEHADLPPLAVRIK